MGTESWSEFDVPTLRISLAAIGTAAPQILFEVDGGSGAAYRELVRCRTTELNLPSTAEDVEAFSGAVETLPAAVVAALSGNDFRRSGLLPPSAVWLDLVSPSGLLPLLPWERLLGFLHRPILRVPASLLQPFNHGGDLEVALCVTSSSGGDPSIAVWQVCRAWFKYAGRRVRIHIFSDPGTYRSLRGYRALRSVKGATSGVILYNPYDLKAERGETVPVPSGPDSVVDPWLRWVRGTLAGLAVDVVQIISPGALSGGRGGVPLMSVPHQGRWFRRTVGAQELGSFLTQVGAWALLLSGPASAGPAGRAGLRELGHSIASLRPGTVAVQELSSNPNGLQLGATIQLVCGGPGGLREAVPGVSCWTLPGGFTLTAAAQYHLLVDALGQSTLLSPSMRQVLSLRDTPAWVAAGSRFLEAQQTRWLGDSVPPEDDSPQGDDSDRDDGARGHDGEAVAALKDAAALLEQFAMASPPRDLQAR